MPTPAHPLPANVIAALAGGNTIDAIKLLRESTGLGLKEAKDAIDAHVRGDPAGMDSAASAPAAVPLPPAVAAALQRGNKIEAIKLLREHSGLGLKEAKDAIDAAGAGQAVRAGGLSPGEVPKAGRALWTAIVIAVVVALAWYFLRRPR